MDPESREGKRAPGRERVRALLVDDDASTHIIVRELLGRAAFVHYDLHAVSSFEEAARALAEDAYDVAIFDYDLGDGHTCLDLLALTRKWDLPTAAVVLTGKAPDPETDQQALALGALDFLEKENLGARALDRSLRYSLAQRRALLRERALARGVVTLNRELEARVRREAAERAVKEKLLSALSHEVRSPAASIRSLVRLLLEEQDGPLAEEQRRQATYIQKAADTILQVSGDLLATYRAPTADGLSVDLVAVDLGELLDTLSGMIAPLIDSDRMSLQVAPPPGRLTVVNDPVKLAQVLRNLCMNAIRHVGRGALRVEVAHDREADAVIFRVSDEGPGIPEDERDRIFEPHFRGQAQQDRTEGAGLGLAICRELAEAMGGSLRLEPGTPTTFTLTVPRVHPLTVSEEDTCTGEACRRVLIVEDDPDDRGRIAGVVRAAGLLPVSAPSLTAARALLGTTRFDAVVLDVLLPDGDGLELLRELRGRPETADLPVTLLSVVTDLPPWVHQEANGVGSKPAYESWLAARLSGVVGQGSRVLLADDDEAARYALRRYLERDFEVLEADNGEIAVELARSTHPDLIFLDMAMPGLSGEQVLDALAQDEATRSIPVVVHSGRSPAEAETLVAESHAVGALPKEHVTAAAVGEWVAQCVRSRNKDGAS